MERPVNALQVAGWLRSALLMGSVVAVLAGCVIVPYPARTEHQSVPVRLESADQVRLSIGRRTLLEEMRKALEKRDRDLVVVDGLAFRNWAFPDGGWLLSDLLEPTRPDRKAPPEADLLLVIGRVNVEQEEHGMMAVSQYGTFGAARAETEASALMLMVDLERGQVLDAIRTHAEGNTVGVGLVVGLIVHATTESSARRAYVDSMVKAIRTVRPHGEVRIALMTAEPAEASDIPLSLMIE